MKTFTYHSANDVKEASKLASSRIFSSNEFFIRFKVITERTN